MRLLALTLAAVCIVPPAFAWEPGPETGPVETTEHSWTDSARDGREVPYRIYAPPAAACPCPVVLFSHGLGGSREAAPYLGLFLAAHGYVVVNIQHPGSDASVWQGLDNRNEIVAALVRAARDLDSAVARFEDVPFALDSLQAMNAAGPLAGRFDLSRIGMSGHSYGAISTMVAAGQRMGPRAQFSFRESRIRGAIAYSPSLPRNARDLAATYRDIAIPVIHITGTEDGSPLATAQGETFSPESRTKPFQAIGAPDQYLLVLTGADHMVFGGQRPGGAAPGDAAIQDAVALSSLAFWQAILKNDATARAWLDAGGVTADKPETGRSAKK
jgi:predicted dienelactone hydrolase